MNITISIPNDYNSDTDAQAAIIACYDGDQDAAESDEYRALYDALANVARDTGLDFVCATDFGAEWAGTDEQIAIARQALPAWAYVGEIESDEDE